VMDIKIIIYYLLSFIAGTAITLQVGINGQLRSNIGSPILASFISFLAGSIGLAFVFAVFVLNGTQTFPDMENIRHSQWWMWVGGLFGAFYIFTSIVAAPKIGFAHMFSLIITGQVLLSVLFDHFGMFGNPVHLINPYRSIGIVFLILGVYIIQTH